MKIPRVPKPYDELVAKIANSAPERLGRIFESSALVDPDGRYLHWDEFKFKKRSDGLTPEEAWFSTKFARRSSLRALPLTDSKGQIFRYCEPPAFGALLRHIDLNAGGSLGSGINALSSVEGKLYLTRSLAEEPFASSLIEGAATTRPIAKKLIFEGRAPITKDERMVLNNYRGLQFVKERRNDVLTLDILLELHRIITQETLDDALDAGRIRTSDDIHVIDDSTGEVLHQPPKFKALPDRLRTLIDFANEREKPGAWLHPLLKGMILHFMIGYEHPFVDGNGRVARALFYWCALRENYWLMEYVSISSVIAESKIRYGKAYLFTETDEGDLTYFLDYNLSVTYEAIERLKNYVDKRRSTLMAFQRHVSNIDLLNNRQSWLLNEFSKHRAVRVTIAEHQARNGVSYLTARTDLERLCELSLLRKEKKGRQSFYLPVRDLVARLSSLSS